MKHQIIRRNLVFQHRSGIKVQGTEPIALAVHQQVHVALTHAAVVRRDTTATHVANIVGVHVRPVSGSSFALMAVSATRGPAAFVRHLAVCLVARRERGRQAVAFVLQHQLLLLERGSLIPRQRSQILVGQFEGLIAAKTTRKQETSKKNGRGEG